MNAEFQWWLLFVGLVIGALLVFLVMADFSRSIEEQSDAELVREAAWINGLLAPGDGRADPALIEDVLRLNREWLAGPAPQPEELESVEPALAGLDSAGVESDRPEGEAPEADL